MISIMSLWTIAFFITSIFECGVHPSVLWSYTEAEDKARLCIDTSMLLLLFAITDVLGDIAILAMPLRPIYHLQKTKSERLGLAGIFLLGTLLDSCYLENTLGSNWLHRSTVAGIVRLGSVCLAFTCESHYADNTVSDLALHKTETNSACSPIRTVRRHQRYVTTLSTLVLSIRPFLGGD